MKKTIIKIMALALVAVMVCAVLVSCAKTLSGEYMAEGDLLGVLEGKTTYKFSGKNVTITNVSGIFVLEKTTKYDGTYEIYEEDGKEYIKFTFEDDDASSYNTTWLFEETEEGIKLNGVEFKKQ